MKYLNAKEQINEVLWFAWIFCHNLHLDPVVTITLNFLCGFNFIIFHLDVSYNWRWKIQMIVFSYLVNIFLKLHTACKNMDIMFFLWACQTATVLCLKINKIKSYGHLCLRWDLAAPTNTLHLSWSPAILFNWSLHLSHVWSHLRLGLPGGLLPSDFSIPCSSEDTLILFITAYLILLFLHVPPNHNLCIYLLFPCYVQFSYLHFYSWCQRFYLGPYFWILLFFWVLIDYSWSMHNTSALDSCSDKF